MTFLEYTITLALLMFIITMGIEACIPLYQEALIQDHNTLTEYTNLDLRDQALYQNGIITN